MAELRRRRERVRRTAQNRVRETPLVVLERRRSVVSQFAVDEDRDGDDQRRQEERAADCPAEYDLSTVRHDGGNRRVRRGWRRTRWHGCNNKEREMKMVILMLTIHEKEKVNRVFFVLLRRRSSSEE